MAAAETPTRLSCLASRSAPCLVRTKMSVRPGAPRDLGGDADLVAEGDADEAVLHLTGRRLVGHRVDGRVGQVPTDQLVDITVERGGEQQALALGRRLVEQRGDRRHEAEVGEVVGFVEHGDLHRVQRRRAALDQVDQATGGRDDEVDAAAERVDLSAHRGAAVDGEGLQPE